MSDRILVVDDEEPILRLIEFNLKRAGFEVAVARDGREALARLQEGVDLLLLDVMLPDVDGFDLLRQIRAESAVPVIFVTAKDEEVDRVVGLEIGADDYLTKPFSPRELVARVRAVLRRVREGGGGGGGEVIVAGPICVDLARHEVRRHGRPVALTRKEFELLAFLVRHAGRALTREQLLDNVWGEDYFGDNRIVDVHIRHLREKLEDDAARPTIIRTVRGVGYRFEDRSPEEG